MLQDPPEAGLAVEKLRCPGIETVAALTVRHAGVPAVRAPEPGLQGVRGIARLRQETASLRLQIPEFSGNIFP